MPDEAESTPQAMNEPTTDDYLRELLAGELPDWWLRTWVEILNRSSDDTSITITLMVDGLLVSGMLVGGRAYFRGLAQDIRENAVGTGSDALAKSVELGAKKYPDVDPDQEIDDDEPPPSFIHLKNARVFSPGDAIRGRGIWWRGRLASVDAFWFGEVTFSG